MAKTADDGQGSMPGVNQVLLSGRLSGPVQSRELPSGDAVVQFRIVVRRPPARVGVSGSAAVIDTIDLACWTKALQRRALGLVEGDVVNVEGALRRRFWRSPGGPTSRYEVEVSALRTERRSGAAGVRTARSSPSPPG